MRARALIALLAVAGLTACGGGSHAPAIATDRAAVAAAIASSRPIGRGPRFQPPTPNRPVRGCRPALGARYGAHVELYAQDRVVLFPAGIGTEPPRRSQGGRILRARCYGPVVTLEPTGLVLVAPGSRATLGDLFAAWGAPLGRDRAASFRGPVRAFVGGHRWTRSPAAIPLSQHAVIVVEIGPFVPPHRQYAFPPGT
jgi:hypothetical protein